MIYIYLQARLFFLKDFIYLFLERREEMEKKRKENIDVRKKHSLVASHMHLNWERNHNPGVCPNGEWNQRPFALWDDGWPTEPHWSGQARLFLNPPKYTVTMMMMT